ncbi:cytochrome P450 [Kitasatospora brasiliensis]|uniref:cytochrome P450 n=1 Tax=Kitasatospora brasiliensis TaxID=3058040 RepID=UPI00292E496A|nr:cytochrome P450 [Kitasatospora sp. K002]
MESEVVITSYSEALDVYRQKDLRQAQYDQADVLLEGVLVNLHGAAHRDRRRVENRLFRRETFVTYERELFPELTRKAIAPHQRAGSAELVSLGHELLLHLAVVVAGIDRPAGTAEETARLRGQVNLFIEALTMAQSTLDKDERRAAVAGGFTDWTEEFLAPSAARRRALLAEEGATGCPVPPDLLGTLLRHQDELGLSDGLIGRETAFFLLVAAHTSATAFVRTVHHMLEWLAEHPGSRELVHTDPFFVQRCVHETIRLNSSSTVGMRRAVEPVVLRSGRKIPAGAKVVIDLAAVNRDESAYGPTADEFDPYREIPAGVMPYGLSFAAGAHVCIGQDLAAGVVPTPGSDPDQHLFGLVALAVRELFRGEVSLDPADPPRADPTTTRRYWSRYPVRLGPRVTVDQESCLSSGRCVEADSTAFRFGPGELAEPSAQAGRLPEERLRRIAEDCPAAAIRLHGI